MSDAPPVIYNVLTNGGSYPSLKNLGFNVSNDNSLLDLYFDLRAKLYASAGMDYYSEPVTPYDRYPTTVFIVPTIDGEVMGGVGLLFMNPTLKPSYLRNQLFPNLLLQKCFRSSL